MTLSKTGRPVPAPVALPAIEEPAPSQTWSQGGF